MSTQRIPITNYKQLAQHLRDALEKREPQDALDQVPEDIQHLLTTDAEKATKLAYDQLYAAPFHQVPTKWRRLYEEARLWSTVYLLESLDDATRLHPKGQKCNLDAAILSKQEAIIEHLDKALIMTGAPCRRPLISTVLAFLEEPDDVLQALCRDDSFECEPAPKKPRLALPPYLQHVPARFPASTEPTPIIQKDITRIKAPFLSQFSQIMRQGEPVIVTQAIAHWPALTRWPDPRYWLHTTHAGRRRVPVEFGRSYTDQGWGQGIIPIGSFLRDELLGFRHGVETDIEIAASDDEEKDDDDDDGHTSSSGDAEGHQKGKGYLAQHDLLTQIPALRRDLSVPDYCYCQAAESVDAAEAESDGDEVEQDRQPLLNMWLGPAGTISPAHTDPHDNLLSQVVGRKYVRLFAPDVGKACLYPMGMAYHAKDKEYSMANTSSLDISLEIEYESASLESAHKESAHKREEQRKKYPDIANASYRECILEAGEMLFIPRGWWHFIKSLDVSASVSFWW